jgi:hypothetical protein
MKEVEMGDLWSRYGVEENACTSLVGKPEGKIPLQ